MERDKKGRLKAHVAGLLYPHVGSYRQQNGEVIKALQKMFIYSIMQSGGDEEVCAKNLNNIVPHCYGDHTGCGDWCKGKTEPNTPYKHRLLPGGKDLTDIQLKNFLTGVFIVLAEHAKALAPCCSTSIVESTNNMMATKAPKRRHFAYI